MFGRIFAPDNWFFRSTGKLVDIVLLSLLWLAVSLPLVTIGPASAALYDTVVRTLRNQEENTPYKRFFRVFRREFKVGALASVVLLAVGFGLYCLYLLLLLMATGGGTGYLLYVAFLVILLLAAGFVSYLFPVLSRFTFGVGGLFVTCGKLSLAHLPVTACLAVVTAAGAWACLRYWWPVIFVPAAAALLSAQLLERIFQPYMKNVEGTE